MDSYESIRSDLKLRTDEDLGWLINLDFFWSDSATDEQRKLHYTRQSIAAEILAERNGLPPTESRKCSPDDGVWSKHRSK